MKGANYSIGPVCADKLRDLAEDRAAKRGHVPALCRVSGAGSGGEGAGVSNIGTRVTCVLCGRTKAPTGRSVADAMAGVLCESDCPGYRFRPLPGDIWPGETREDFGYPCRTATELEGVGDVYGE